MLDLGTQLRDYLDATAPAVELEDIVAAPVGDANVRPIRARRTARPTQAWGSAAAAAIVVLLLVGGMAWLLRSNPPERPVSRTTVTPTTVAPTTTPPPGSTTTLPAVPIVSPGDGPTLTFVQGESPVAGRSGSAASVGLLGDGVWFQEALYVLAASGNGLYRSSDGISWELVSGWRGAQSRTSSLQTDGDRLVSVVIADDTDFIEVSTSTNGDDWASSRVQLPLIGDSTMAGEFRVADAAMLAVGPRGIVVTATISVGFEAEGFANGLVDPDDGIHVEILDLDLDRGVMTVQFLDENNDMAEIGDPREVDLEAAGFSAASANLLDAMEADPDWEPRVSGFLAQLNSEGSAGGALVSVGYAWFSTDGATWQRAERFGPLDGGKFTAVLAMPDGFVATASNTFNPSELPPNLRYLAQGFDNGIVWESSDGITWTEAANLTNINDGSLPSEFDPDPVLDLWDEEPVQLVLAERRADESRVWTLADPPQRVFADIPTDGMRLQISALGLLGALTFGSEEPEGRIEMLLSVDGMSWNRWAPPEFGEFGLAEAWIVGVGDDFVVVQIQEFGSTLSHSFWVGTLP